MIESLTNFADFAQVIESTRTSCAQRGANLTIINQSIMCRSCIIGRNITKNGMRPFSLSWAMASASGAPHILKSSLLSMYRSFTKPISPAFSTEL